MEVQISFLIIEGVGTESMSSDNKSTLLSLHCSTSPNSSVKKSSLVAQSKVIIFLLSLTPFYENPTSPLSSPLRTNELSNTINLSLKTLAREVSGPASLKPAETFSYSQHLRSHVDLLHQNLHFHKIPWGFMSTLNSKKHLPFHPSYHNYSSDSQSL